LPATVGCITAVTCAWPGFSKWWSQQNYDG